MRDDRPLLPADSLPPDWFRRLWAGTVSSNLADGVLVAAAPLLAATVTRDPLLVSGLVVAQNLPWLLFTLAAGVIVDRYDRRRLLFAANTARALAIGGLTFATATGGNLLVVLYAAVFVVGAAETIADNAALAVLPRLVERDRLEHANGRIFATQSVLNELVGPPLGAALFGLAATAAFLTGSVAFALAAAAMALLPRHLSPERSTDRRQDRVMAQLGQGLHYFWEDRLLRTVAVMAGAVNLFGAATSGVLVLLATSEFGLSSAQYGLLLATGAAGGITAGLVADRLVRVLGSGRVIFLSNLLPALGYAVIAIASQPLLAAAALAVSSFASTVGNVVVITLRQASVPDHLLGRVTSAYRLVALGALPVGGLLGGIIASAFGLRAPFVIGAICLALLAVGLAPVLTTRVLDAATGKTQPPDAESAATTEGNHS